MGQVMRRPTFGVVEGTAPPYGYGYGASQFVYEDHKLPGTSYPQTPYPAQMYGRNSQAELHGFQLGSFLDTIQSIVAGVTAGATDVENIARGAAVAGTAAGTVLNQAATGGKSLTTPSAADIAAQQSDVMNLLGVDVNKYLVIGAAGLVLILFLAGRRSSS